MKATQQRRVAVSYQIGDAIAGETRVVESAGMSAVSIARSVSRMLAKKHCKENGLVVEIAQMVMMDNGRLLSGQAVLPMDGTALSPDVCARGLSFVVNAKLLDWTSGAQ